MPAMPDAAVSQAPAVPGIAPAMRLERFRRLVLRRRHTMFWIPMEWWSLASLLVGAVVAVQWASGAR